MNQLSFGGAIIPAMAGFFFGNRAKVQEIREEKTHHLVVLPDPSGETGVTKYLMSVPSISSVAKYVTKKEKHPVTGVAKYVLRRTLAVRNMPSTTGVTRYLVNSANQQAVRKTGVDKYLIKQKLAEEKQFLALTGVARYEAEQELLARKKLAAAMTEKYCQSELEAQLAREAAEIERVALELANASPEDYAVEEADMLVVTGVGRYLKGHGKVSKQPSPTGVSRYLSKKIISDSQKPKAPLSKVGKYLQDQAIAEIKKPKPTGVAKYLLKLGPDVVRVQKEKPVPSGVARYLEVNSGDVNKPVLSGVAKYLREKEKLGISHDKLARLPHLQEHVSDERCLEGEFIPANESLKFNTGVSRYLEKQDVVIASSKDIKNRRLTGVSRYLDKQAGVSKHVLADSTPTGVDRYLLKRA